MNATRWIIVGVSGFVVLTGLALALPGGFSRSDARRQLDEAFTLKERFVYDVLNLITASGATPIKEELLDTAISRAGAFIQATDSQLQQLREQLGDEGIKKFYRPFDYDQLASLRQTFATGLVERVLFQKQLGNGMASTSVRTQLKPIAKRLCLNYEEGNNSGCRFAAAQWKVKSISGVRDGIERGVPAKVVEFEAIAEPTEEGRKFVSRQPTGGSFIAAFIEYDDGWRLAVGPFQKF